MYTFFLEAYIIVFCLYHQSSMNKNCHWTCSHTEGALNWLVLKKHVEGHYSSFISKSFIYVYAMLPRIYALPFI